MNKLECGKHRLFRYWWASLVAVLLMVGVAEKAFAACNTINKLALEFRFPNYPLWKAAAEDMQQCGNLTVNFEFDAARVEVDSINPDENLGSLVGVSNASLARLSGQKLIQPLDGLVEKYRDRLHPRQLIREDGRVMAIAVAANTKALMYHATLFRQEKIEPPKTYDQLIAVAEKLKGGGDAKLYSHPISLAFESGWNLTQEFIDQFLAGANALLLDEGNRPALNNELGVATLERIKKLSTYLPEDHLDADPSTVLSALLKFKAPMSVLWISSAGPLDNPAVSRVPGKMEIVAPPTVLSGGKPAATLWWDGFAIPASASPEQAEAAFVTALEGLDADMLEKHSESALWLLKDYKPNRLTEGILRAIDEGIPAYPASEALVLLRRAISPHLIEFMKGKIQAAQALGLAEADYIRAARERGIAGF